MRSTSKRLRLSPWAMVLALLAACAPGGFYVSIAPPPVRVEMMPGPPGTEFVWIAGFWAWDGWMYLWVPGRWERHPRPGVVWVPGHWRDTRRGWVWVPGRWR
jgi:hypothetical protein